MIWKFFFLICIILFIQRELNKKKVVNKKTLVLLLDENTYNEIYKFSLSGTDIDKNIKIINDIVSNNGITENITELELEYLGLILKYNIYFLHKTNVANNNLEYLIHKNPEIINFTHEELNYIYILYTHYLVKKDIQNFLILENIDFTSDDIPPVLPDFAGQSVSNMDDQERLESLHQIKF